MTKDEETTQLTFRIPTPLHREFKITAARKGEAMTAVVLRCVKRYVEENRGEGEGDKPEDD